MNAVIRIATAVLLLAICVSAQPAAAQQAAAAPALNGAAAGKDILQKKCFQCHQPTMWASLKQDRKAWASTLYRMVGRGALWTEDEINAMADFLAETRGPGK